MKLHNYHPRLWRLASHQVGSVGKLHYVQEISILEKKIFAEVKRTPGPRSPVAERNMSLYIFPNLFRYVTVVDSYCVSVYLALL